MPAEFRITPTVYLKRKLLWAVFKPLVKLLIRVELTGKENIPKEGAYIITPNHVSLYESPLLLALWPRWAEPVVGADVWSRPGQGFMTRWHGGIPVDRGNYDREVLEKALAVLRAGRPLLLVPEGGRSRKPGLRRGKPGVAYVMDQAGVPVVPVGVTGTHGDALKRALTFRQPRIQVNIGKPFTLPPIEENGEARRAARQANADQVMLRIAELLPPEYHGVYAGQVPGVSGDEAS